MDNTEEFKEQISHPEISAELRAMVDADQDMREQSEKVDGFWDEQIDQDNTKRLKEIIAEYGFPTISMVGIEGSLNAWLLAQHADHDLEFQKECLELMKKIPLEEIDRTKIAYLEDRIRVNKKHLQLYGTQFEQKDGKHVPRPIEDVENVNERRAELGMDTLADQIDTMYEKYDEPDEWILSARPELSVKVIKPNRVDLLVSLRRKIDGDKDSLEREAKKYAEADACQAFILEQFLEPVGYVQVNLSEELPVGATVDEDLSNFAHLARIGVIEEEQEKHLGTELMKLAEQYAIKSAKEGIWLDFLDRILKSGKSLEEFYVKMGYSIKPEFTDENGKQRKIGLKYFNK